MGWIGLMVEKKGKATPYILSEGFIEPKRIIAQGCQFVRPVSSKQRYEEKFKQNYKTRLEALGFRGVMVWFCDAQWAKDGMPITKSQWDKRVKIEGGK